MITAFGKDLCTIMWLALWFRYTKGDGGLTQSTSFSDILQLDLNQFS
ncbi:hypothetical protein [Spirosoma aerophilum]